MWFTERLQYNGTASPFEDSFTFKGHSNDRSTRRDLAENLLGTIKSNGKDLESGNADLKALYQMAIDEASVMHRAGFLGLSGARYSIPDPKSRVCRMIVALCKACDPNFSTYEKSCRVGGVQREGVTTVHTNTNGGPRT